MYRKWSKTVLVAISVTALAFGIPNSASAQTSQNLDDVLSAPIQNYMQNIEDAYKYPYSDLTEAHLNALLQSDSRDDQQNAIASSQAAQDLVCFQKGSLDIISASVESSILSSEVISNTAQVAVLETKTIESHSSDGSTVTLYDGETEDLTSVWQDIHILTLSASSGNAYTVISDQLVDYSEYMQANDLAAFAKKYSKNQNLFGIDSDLPDTAYTDSVPNTQDEGNLPGDTSPQPRASQISEGRMLNYVVEWTTGPVDTFNTEYPIFKSGGNCTNFVSQAVHAGGQALVPYNLVTKYFTNVWDYDTEKNDSSRTWSNADYNYKFMLNHSGSFTAASSVFKTYMGSIIYYDWIDSSGANNPDGTLDHANIVVGVSSDGMRYISQKSPLRANIPYSTFLLKAYSEGKTKISTVELNLIY